MDGIDANIALGVRPLQIKSQGEYLNELYAQKNAEQSNQLNAMKMDEYKRGLATTERRNSLLGGFTPDMTVDEQVNKLVQGGFLDEAKSLAESASKVSKDKRESEKALTDTQAARIKLHRDLLPAVRDQGSYEQWAMGAVKDIPELAQILPAQYTPETITNLAMTADKFIESKKPHFVNQENVMINGVPTTRVLQVPSMGGAASTVAGSEGATYNKPAGNINVNTNMPPQEKQFEIELGKEQAKTVLANKTKAEDAAKMLATNKVATNLLDKGMLTGTGANFFTDLNQGLKLGGLDFGYGDAAANSQAYGALMASNTASIIKSFGSGTGLSDADREYALSAAGGKINMDEKAIRKIISINSRAAQNVITKHNKNVEGIKTNIPLAVNVEDYTAGIPNATDTTAADGRKPLANIFKSRR